MEKEFLTREVCKQMLIDTIVDHVEGEKYILKSHYYNQLLRCKKLKNLKESLIYNTKNLNKNARMKQACYYILYDVFELPKCPECGKDLRLADFDEGFTQFCSHECSVKSPIRAAKIKATCLEKKDEMLELSKAGCLAKHGVEFTGKIPEAKEKRKKTFFENWDVTSSFALPQTKETISNKTEEEKCESKEKSKKTCLNKYGHEFISQVPEIKKKIKNKWDNKDEEELIQIQNKKTKTRIKSGFTEKIILKNLKFEEENFYKHQKRQHNIATHIYCDSSTEKEFIDMWLEFYPKETIERCFKIEYEHNKKQRKYSPDFVVTYPDGKKDIIEIKCSHPYFYEDLYDGSLFAKWDFTNKYIEEHNEFNSYIFILNGKIVTKEYIEQNFIKVEKRY